MDATTRREKIRGTAARPHNIEGRFFADPAKALVMSYVDQLVGDGHAEWGLLDNGDIELRFFTGEIFVLADTSITRII